MPTSPRKSAGPAPPQHRRVTAGRKSPRSVPAARAPPAGTAAGWHTPRKIACRSRARPRRGPPRAGILREKLRAAPAHAPGGPAEPHLLGNPDLPSRRADPLLRQPIAEVPAPVAEPEHARIMAYGAVDIIDISTMLNRE